VIFFHGNGESVADYLPDFADTFNHLGVNALFAKYRGYGGSTGQPALGTMLEDVESIFVAAGVAEARVVAMGRSVGSIYAIELARRHPGIAGLVLESGIADVLERLELRVRPEELGTTRDALAAEVAAKLDHRAKLGAYPGRFLALHARGDHLVAPSHAERNHTWAAGPDKELVILPNGDHNSIFAANADAYVAALGRFLARCGARPSPSTVSA
jgi:pimeloyl-ACP methyl ester carboxylesterase